MISSLYGPLFRYVQGIVGSLSEIAELMAPTFSAGHRPSKVEEKSTIHLYLPEACKVQASFFNGRLSCLLQTNSLN